MFFQTGLTTLPFSRQIVDQIHTSKIATHLVLTAQRTLSSRSVNMWQRCLQLSSSLTKQSHQAVTPAKPSARLPPPLPSPAALVSSSSRRCSRAQRAAKRAPVTCAAASTSGGVLISKTEVPAFIPRDDMADQIVRWAIIESSDNAISKFGMPFKVCGAVPIDRHAQPMPSLPGGGGVSP